MDHGTVPTLEVDEQRVLAFAAAERLVDDLWADPTAAQRDWGAELAALEAALAADLRREAADRRALLDGPPGAGSLRAAEEVLAGGPALTGRQSADPAYRDALGDAVVSAFAAVHRVTSYALWVQVAATARLLTLRAGRTPSLPRRTRSRRVVRDDGDSLVADEVATELALAAGITVRMARSRVEAAKALVLDDRLPATAALLQEGRLDWARVAAVLGRTRDLGVENARAVEARLYAVPDLWGRGLTRFEQELDAALLAVDADAVEARRQRSRRSRRVGIRTAPDGSAFFTATGPAEAIVAAHDGIDAAARRQRAEGDPRTMDQLRFDLFVTAGTSGSLPGLAAALPVPPASGDCPCGGRDRASEASDSAPPTPTVVPAAVAEHDDQQPSWFTSHWPEVQVTVNVTVSAETLMGLTDDPGILQGYGPIPAGAVRDLATNGVFRCLVVDGEHGTVLGVGRSTFTPGYTPGARLKLLAGYAFPMCDVPGCGRSSRRCDLDHQIPYAAGGPTCLCNVRPLCRTHHRLKTAGLLTAARAGSPADPDSSLTWVTRTGRAYPTAGRAPHLPGGARPPGPSTLGHDPPPC